MQLEGEGWRAEPRRQKEAAPVPGKQQSLAVRGRPGMVEWKGCTTSHGCRKSVEPARV